MAHIRPRPTAIRQSHDRQSDDLALAALIRHGTSGAMRYLDCALFGLALIGFALIGPETAHGHGKGQGHGHHGKKKKHHHHDEYAVDGDFSVVTNPPHQVAQVAPDLCILELTATFSFAGDLEGSFTSDFSIEHLGPCDQPALEVFSTEGVYVGEVLGAEGSFEYTFDGTIDGQGIATGDFVILEDSGTDELDELEEGTITLTGLAGVGGTYSGEIEFD
ncbi:DUF3224 domain-containing protein [Nannocystaceae bacterium ST9]